MLLKSDLQLNIIKIMLLYEMLTSLRLLTRYFSLVFDALFWTMDTGSSLAIC